MQVQRVAIHHLPPPTPQPPALKGPAIPFHQFLVPFVQLLMGAAGHVLWTTFAVAQYCQRNILAIEVVIKRLIHAPSFDPTSPAFQEGIEQLEKQVPLLQKRIDQLEQKFWQQHLISRDMAELKKLNDEIYRAFRQLDLYVLRLKSRTHPFPIQDKLTEVRDAFLELDDQMDLYCLNNGNDILGKFQATASLFSKGGVDLPKDIQHQLVQSWQDLEAVFKLRLRNLNHLPETGSLYSKLHDIKDIMKFWMKKPKASPTKTEESIDSIEPLKLRNIGNSCYLDSVLQAILCIDHVREKLGQAPERDAKTSLKDYQREVAIQQEILQFMDVQQIQRDGEQMSQMEFILFLMGGPSIHRLRDAIFKSDFHHEFEVKNIGEQQDAANIMELLIDHLLGDCKFQWRGHASTAAFPGLEFIHGGVTGKDEEVAILQVPLRSKAAYQKLDILVKAILGKHVEKQSDPDIQRKFDPADGVVVEGKEEEAALVQHATPTKVDEFCEWYRLKKMPPVLTIQFKRFTAGLAKDSRPVTLPENGILDLSRYYDAPSGESKKAVYRIKSMVRHSGKALRWGHYVADIELDGKYYHCDDTDPKAFKEISKKEFLGRKDPYLLFLERIPDDEIEEALKSKKTDAPQRVTKIKSKDLLYG